MHPNLQNSTKCLVRIYVQCAIESPYFMLPGKEIWFFKFIFTVKMGFSFYRFQAADDDEVSFIEGDLIINTEIIDQGWMSGTVKRTGHTGMLPSNYVEPQWND